LKNFLVAALSLVLVVSGSVVEAKPASSTARQKPTPRPAAGGERLPSQVWVKGNYALLVGDPGSKAAHERGFKLKRGTHLRVSPAPKKNRAYYYVTVDDSVKYPASGKFDAGVTGFGKSGYVSRSAVSESSYKGGILTADELVVTKATRFKPVKGPELKLLAGTKLWAVTGKKEGTRYLVQLDDWEKYPAQTKVRLEGYVDANAVGKRWIFPGVH
jgi:hypothetical protein